MPKPPIIAITVGEPAGIGPDLCLRLIEKSPEAQIVFIADPDVLQQRAELLGITINLPPWQQHTEAPFSIVAIPSVAPVIAGQLDATNASYVLACLDRAISGCLQSEFDALVTAPINKAVINDAGINFTGHTEYLASRTNSPQVVMMLATNSLKVAIATTHLPLRDVAKQITSDHLENVIKVLHSDLEKRFGMVNPSIMICGLNPHAGESGHLGDEEQTIMIPLIKKLRQTGLNLQGPIPADTAFTPNRLKQADVVLAMYHDQGLPVLKALGFGQAVNITLGLPFIRTSVDHGTALDLAGTTAVDTSSMEAAIAMAIAMKNR